MFKQFQSRQLNSCVSQFSTFRPIPDLFAAAINRLDLRRLVAITVPSSHALSITYRNAHHCNASIFLRTSIVLFNYTTCLLSVSFSYR